LVFSDTIKKPTEAGRGGTGGISRVQKGGEVKASKTKKSRPREKGIGKGKRGKRRGGPVKKKMGIQRWKEGGQVPMARWERTFQLWAEG